MELAQVSTDALVKQHNAITSGRYDFSACQLDIMFMLLANLKETDEPNKRYNIRVKDIELITGRKWNYDQLKTNTEDLMGRVYEIQLEKSFRQITLFSLVEYLDGTGSFDLVVNDYARPYFFEFPKRILTTSRTSPLTRQPINSFSMFRFTTKHGF